MGLINTPHFLDSAEGAEVCWYCGVALTPPVEGRPHVFSTRTKDHVFPLTLGGTSMEHNKIPCCNRCNQWKGFKTLDQFRLVARPGEDDEVLFYGEVREKELRAAGARLSKARGPFNDLLATKLREALRT